MKQLLAWIAINSVINVHADIFKAAIVAKRQYTLLCKKHYMNCASLSVELQYLLYTDIHRGHPLYWPITEPSSVSLTILSCISLHTSPLSVLPY